MGEVLIRKGDPDSAEREFLKALGMKKYRAWESYGAAGYWLGTIAAERGDEGKAIAYLRESLRHEPSNAAACYYLGFLLAKRNRLDEAVPLFEKALELAPDNADAHFSLGKALLLLNRRERGIFHLREALGLDPGHEQARRLLESLGTKAGGGP
jgi:tetratricopeptide (TPR) repeat protein